MMKCIAHIILWLCLLWFVSSCKNNDLETLPKPLNDTIPVEVPLSTFHIPITYSLNELEQYLNQKIKGQFYETTIEPTKNEKEQVKIEMTKLSDIQLSGSQNNLICHVPLHVKATILNSRMNFITKGIKPVETDLILELHTPTDLDKEWRLVTQFKLVSIQWKKDPMIRVAGIPFNLREKLEAYLEENKGKLTGLLDEEINKSVSLEKPVSKIWLDLQKPMIVVKKPPRAYIRFVCHDISGDFKLQGKDFICFTTIHAQVAMVTETNIKAPIKKLPPFKLVNQNQRTSNAWVYAFAEFDQINEGLERLLQGKVFSLKQYSTTVKMVRTYASDSGLTVLMEAKGDIDATLAATVSPGFDSVSQTFIMENFQFKVVSDNVLLNIGDALLHDMVRDTVQTYLAMEMDTLIRKVPGIIENAISKGKTGKSIDLKVSEFEIISCAVNLGARRIHLLVHTKLNSEIEIKKINAGKGIKIKGKEEKIFKK